MPALEVHQLAEIFPAMSADDYRRLRDSIAEQGLLESIVLHEGKILDGRHRYRACEETGRPIKTMLLNGHDPLAFVLAKNLTRRHLDESQRAMVAARLATLPNHRPDKESGPIGLVQPEAAKALGVGVRNVKRARVVIEQGSPALVHAVDAGRIAVSAAAAIAALPVQDQAAVVAEENPTIRRKKVREAKDRARERSARARETPQPLVLTPSRSSSKSRPAFYTVDAWNMLSADERTAIVADGFTSSAKMNPQDSTRIEWAQHSLNTVTGCLHNCPYCYARDIAVKKFPAYGFKPVFHPARLAAPGNATPPPEARHDTAFRNVFANSMSDLFGQWVPAEWIAATIEMARRNPRWNFLTLTKFPSRGAEFDVPDNWWLGATVDAQCRVAATEKAFAKIRAKTTWLSIEPMLEPLTFTRLDLFTWIVIGGASPSTKTPEWMPPFDWVVDLHVQARKAGCRIYHKTNLGLHDGARLREFPWAEPKPTKVPRAFHYLKGIGADD